MFRQNCIFVGVCACVQHIYMSLTADSVCRDGASLKVSQPRCLSIQGGSATLRIHRCIYEACVWERVCGCVLDIVRERDGVRQFDREGVCVKKKKRKTDAAIITTEMST